ncbi:MAG: serine/threonine protein kinase [Azoarcus sp.]|jgi:serine/threonine protein kinase|nr:serine/threonine protein kinase [Azoarcus sp.]
MSAGLFGLPAGFRLRELELLSILGGGKRSLVYKAYDHALNRHVAVKEFLPVDHVRRDLAHVEARQEQRESFERGLARFISEARIMTRFNHPVLRGAFSLIQENGTAYIVMPYYDGTTLREMTNNGFRAKNMEDIFSFLLPILSGLSYLYNAGYGHYCISPDNILVREDGTPVLLDFGAVGELGQSAEECLLTELIPGFAAPEQYGHGETCLGVWTDIYAFSAVAYHMVTGLAPPPAVSRIAHDALKPLASLASPGLPSALLEVFERGLAIEAKARPRDIVSFANALQEAAYRAISQSARPESARILAADAAVSAFSPRIRRILQFAWNLREKIHPGART